MKLRLLSPVKDRFPISSPFGMRTIFGKERMHNGIDFSAPEGSPVIAMAPGKIFRAGFENPENKKQGYGFRVWQEFMYEMELYYAWYGHLNEICVKENNFVEAGSVIGFTGNTGRSTGPHLHVGVRKKNTGIYYDMEFYNA